MYRGLSENRRKRVLADGFSLLTATEDAATGLIMYRGKVPFPYFEAAMRPEHNHTHGQPLPSKSEFLSLN
jgi:hypothetical protein